MNTYADDLATLIERLELREVILVGHSTGGGEVTRYLSRHGAGRAAKLALIGSVTPLMANYDALVVPSTTGGTKTRSRSNRPLPSTSAGKATSVPMSGQGGSSGTESAGAGEGGASSSCWARFDGDGSSCGPRSSETGGSSRAGSKAGTSVVVARPSSRREARCADKAEQ